MNTLYDFEDIDDYVKGRMSDADRVAFEAAMGDDPKLAAQVEALHAEATVLRSLRREGLLEKMAEWEQEIPAKPRIVPMWRRWPLMAAAAAITLLLVWTLWPDFQTKQSGPGIVGQPGLHDSSSDKTASNGLNDSLTKSPEKRVVPSQKQTPTESPYAEMAIRNFNTDYSSINLMGDQAAAGDRNPLQLAAEAIEGKRYEAALGYLKKIPSGNADDYTAAQIMAGDVYFLQKKFALAEKAYIQPAQSKKDKFRDVAQWHLLLTYLAVYPQKSSDFERIVTTILNDPDHPYVERAKKVQSQMNKE